MGNVLDADHSLKEISAFVRNGAGEAYVPGSSVKGALRTAILFREIRRRGSLPEQKRGKIPEESYLNVLAQNPRQQDNAINSLLRGVSVADSMPISDAHLALARKVDVRTDGVEKTPTVVRECVRPGVELSFQLTLDRSILGNRLQASDILAAVAEFFAYYRAKFNARFPTIDANAPARRVSLPGRRRRLFQQNARISLHGLRSGPAGSQPHDAEKFWRPQARRGRQRTWHIASHAQIRPDCPGTA